MGATVKQNMDSFLGQKRQPGDRIEDEELEHLTANTLQALVASKIIELDGNDNPAGGGGLSELDVDRLDRLQATGDKTNELLAAVLAQLKILASPPDAKPAKVTTKSRRAATASK